MPAKRQMSTTQHSTEHPHMAYIAKGLTSRRSLDLADPTKHLVQH